MKMSHANCTSAEGILPKEKLNYYFGNNKLYNMNFFKFH